MLDVEALSLSQYEQNLLAHPLVGGVILFSRNFETPLQLRGLVSEIRQASPEIIIAVDQEGGVVQRFKEGFTRIPAMSAFGKLYEQNAALAADLCKDCGWLMAAELAGFDIDISFAPVLDIDFSLSKVIGSRSFSANPEIIVHLARSFIEGMHEAGMSATGKHFPGHGGVEADSHTDIPIDGRTLDVLTKHDMSVFASLIDSGLDALMPAHVVYSSVDKKPAGFSSKWLQEILRTKLKFEGVIFSDDLSMQGASLAGGYTERAIAAFAAGCDMVLVCNNPDGANEVLKYLETIEHKQNAKLATMCLNRNKVISTDSLGVNSRWLATREKLCTLN